MLQPVEEHKGISKGEVRVMSVRGLRKQCRVRKLAVERHQKMKERTSRHATVAWRKSKLFRKSETQENCGPRKELATAGMRESPECKNGIRCRDVKEPPHLRIGRKIASSSGGRNRREQQRLEDMSKYNDIYWRTIGLNVRQN
jgi:hypothetical protein